VSTPLSVRDTMMLDFERSWWKYAGAKDEEIREQFGLTSVRYYAVLNGLIDRPEAMAYDAMVVRRLLRLRERRAMLRVDVSTSRPYRPVLSGPETH
jgi:hypothetical protein